MKKLRREETGIEGTARVENKPNEHRRRKNKQRNGQKYTLTTIDH